MKTKNKVKKSKKRRKLKKIFLFILLILLVFSTWFIYKVEKNGGGLSGVFATLIGHDENTKKDLDEIKVLLLGISTDLGSKLTDTIIVASYNPNTQKANLLSIPRDTYIGSNVKKATASQKINSLYSANKNNPKKTLEAVNEITGLDIEYYMVIKTEGLINLVDALGSVEFDVPIDMDYDDPTQNLHIHLKSGLQDIDGEKAEQLLRFRHNNDYSSYPYEYGDNDIGRMRTQREFITATLKQTLSLNNILKIGKLVDIAKKNIDTNLKWSYVKDYIPYIVQFDTDNLETASLPGTTPDYRSTNYVSLFVYDKTKTDELIQTLFYPADDSLKS